MHQILRVLVVDDSAYVRKVIKQMLSRSPFIEVVGTARDGEEALGLVQELHPHVVTLDLMMPGMGGLGFILGDGRLTYGREVVSETYYNAHVVSGLYMAVQLSFVDNPGYNRDRGPVIVPGVRAHVDF